MTKKKSGLKRNELNDNVTTVTVNEKIFSHNTITKAKIQQMAHKVTHQANQVQDRSLMAQEALEHVKQVERAVHTKAEELEKERSRLMLVEQSLTVDMSDLNKMKMDVIRQRVNFLKEKNRETE